MLEAPERIAVYVLRSLGRLSRFCTADETSAPCLANPVEPGWTGRPRPLSPSNDDCSRPTAAHPSNAVAAPSAGLDRWPIRCGLARGLASDSRYVPGCWRRECGAELRRAVSEGRPPSAGDHDRMSAPSDRSGLACRLSGRAPFSGTKTRERALCWVRRSTPPADPASTSASRSREATGMHRTLHGHPLLACPLVNVSGLSSAGSSSLPWNVRPALVN